MARPLSYAFTWLGKAGPCFKAKPAIKRWGINDDDKPKADTLADARAKAAAFAKRHHPGYSITVEQDGDCFRFTLVEKPQAASEPPQ